MWVQWMNIALTIVKRLTFKGFSFFYFFRLLLTCLPISQSIGISFGNEAERTKGNKKTHNLSIESMAMTLQLTHKSKYFLYVHVYVYCVCACVWLLTREHFFLAILLYKAFFFLVCHLRTEQKTHAAFFLYLICPKADEWLHRTHSEQSWMNLTIKIHRYTSSIYCRFVVVVVDFAIAVEKDRN